MVALLLAAALAQPDLRELERVARLSLEAARSKSFYFVVDVPASTLTLNLGGVILERYPLEDVDVGFPLIGRGTGEELLSIHSCESTRDRKPPEIQPGVPPPPEDREPMPARLSLDCGDTLSIHLVRSSLSLGLRDRFRLPGDPEVGARVRITLAVADADRLFSSLPSQSSWIFSFVESE